MLIDGVEVPDNIAGDVGMREAFIMNAKNKPAEDLTPKPEPTTAPVLQPTPVPEPAPAPTPSPVPTATFSESEYVELKAKHAAQEQQIAELSKKASLPTKIIDPDLYRLAIIKEKSPEKFSTFASLKITNSLSPFDVLVDDYVAKNPEYKDRRDVVSSFLKNTYGLDKPIPEPLDPDVDSEEDISRRTLEIGEAKRALEFGDMRMKNDAKIVMSALEAEFNAIELPETTIKTPDQINQEKAQAKAGWTPVVDKIFESMKSIPVFVQDKDAKEPTEFLSYEIPADLLPAYKAQMTELCVENGIPLTTDGATQVIAGFVSRFKREHEARIMDAVVKKARTLTEQEYDQAYHNPSALKDQQTRTDLPTETPYEKSQRLAFEAETGRR